MEYRKLGKTNIKVSEIGFGAWAIGKEMWGSQEDKDSIAALNKALDLGCNFLDTAIIGTRNTKQAEMNFNIYNERKLSKEQLEQLKQLWVSGKIGGLIFA